MPISSIRNKKNAKKVKFKYLYDYYRKKNIFKTPASSLPHPPGNARRPIPCYRESGVLSVGSVIFSREPRQQVPVGHHRPGARPRAGDLLSGTQHALNAVGKAGPPDEKTSEQKGMRNIIYVILL